MFEYHRPWHKMIESILYLPLWHIWINSVSSFMTHMNQFCIFLYDTYESQGSLDMQKEMHWKIWNYVIGRKRIIVSDCWTLPKRKMKEGWKSKISCAMGLQEMARGPDLLSLLQKNTSPCLRQTPVVFQSANEIRFRLCSQHNLQQNFELWMYSWAGCSVSLFVKNELTITVLTI